METTHFSYTGPRDGVLPLAQALRAKGIEVNFDPSTDTKDLATAVALVSVVFAASGSIPDIVSCVRDFASRTGARVQGAAFDQSASGIELRLERLDQLKSRGAITDHEYDLRRAQIIGEL